MIIYLNELSGGKLPDKLHINFDEWLKKRNKKEKIDKLEDFVRDNIEYNLDSFLTFTDVVDKFKISDKYSAYQLKNIKNHLITRFEINYYNEKWYNNQIHKDVFDCIKFRN